MDWTTPPESQPVWSPADPGATVAGSVFQAEPPPAGGPPVAPSERLARTPVLGGLRRTAATALLAVGLLVVGGVAVVNAADPSASPAPNATTQPPGGGNGTAPGPNRVQGAAPNGQMPAGRGHDCPNMGGAAPGSQGSGGSGGSAAPSAATGASSSNG